MKDHMDMARTKAGERKFPKFKAGQAVTTIVPEEFTIEKHWHVIPRRSNYSGLDVTPGRMCRVVRAYALECIVLDLRTLTTLRIPTYNLCRW